MEQADIYLKQAEASEEAMIGVRTRISAHRHVVALDQGEEILALENSRNCARHRNRQHLARLVIDSGFVIGSETEAADWWIEVRLIVGALPEGNLEGWFIHRHLQREIRYRAPGRSEASIGPAMLLDPAFGDLGCEHVVRVWFRVASIDALIFHARVKARFLGGTRERALNDRSKRLAVEALDDVLGLIGDDADRGLAIFGRRIGTVEIARIGRKQDHYRAMRIGILVTLDLVRILLDGLDRG